MPLGLELTVYDDGDGDSDGHDDGDGHDDDDGDNDGYDDDTGNGGHDDVFLLMILMTIIVMTMIKQRW